MSETYCVRLDHPLPDAIGARLRAAIPDPGLLEGLLASLVHRLSRMAQDPSALDTVGVTVHTGPTLIEVQLRRGSLRESLVCTLPEKREGS